MENGLDCWSWQMELVLLEKAFTFSSWSWSSSDARTLNEIRVSALGLLTSLVVSLWLLKRFQPKYGIMKIQGMSCGSTLLPGTAKNSHIGQSVTFQGELELS